jgi:hypothetical protein
MAKHVCNEKDVSLMPKTFKYAYAYVPYQQFGEGDKTYSPEESLEYGTVFPDLNFPYKKEEI